MSLTTGLSAAVIEKLPLVRFADVTDDGQLELVIGPKASGSLGTILRHLPGITIPIPISSVDIVVGVR